MPTTDFEGFKKNGTTIPVKDSTARTSISAIEEKIPSGASSSNKLATASDVAAKISSTEKGTNNGVATLGSDGRVPTSQLPSYVDDILEYASTSAFPATGEAGKIYVALDTNKMYRWSGSTYTEVSESVALGETQGTAYEGNKGKANADNITNIQAVIPSGATSSNKLATASDVTAVSDAVSAIKDGTDIDSFSDVESALGDVDTAINGIKDGTDIDSFSDVESALSNKADKSTVNGILNGQSIDSFGDVESALADKVDKVSGKGLSTNDYDNTEKDKVAGAFSRSEQAVLGAKNLLPIDIATLKAKNTTGTWSGNVYTSNNVTFTVSTDDKGFITKITIGGSQASANTLFWLLGDNYNVDHAIAFPNGNYKLNGITGGSESTYFIEFGSYNSDGTPVSTFVKHTNDDTDITIPQNKKSVCVLRVQSGNTVNSDVYPMLRLATDTDSTYAPYAKTNRELTEDARLIADEPTYNANIFTAERMNLSDEIYHLCKKQFGHVCIITINDFNAISDFEIPSWTQLFYNLPAPLKPFGGVPMLITIGNRETIVPAQFDTRNTNPIGSNSWGISLAKSVTIHANESIRLHLVYITE